MGEIIISLKNIGVKYRRGKTPFKSDYYEALKSVSFDVKKGETLGVIGRNGAGKSTLLKILSGIYRPDSGTIVNTANRTSLLSLRAGFDNNLSGRDNAVISGMLMGYPKQTVEEQLENIAEYSELGEFFHQQMITYSSGMRARLGFAVANSLRPEVLLIDEVLGVGDASFREKAAKTMEGMMKSDQTCVLVSHSAASISRLCDRVVWIEDGVVKMEGPADEVVKAYRL